MRIDNNIGEKPIKEYDTNCNGKIDGEEISIFKTDCKSLYKKVYGEESRQYKETSALLDKTEIKFSAQSVAGSMDICKNNYDKEKYVINLTSRPEGKNLKDSNLNITDYAGILLHEAEHLVQVQKEYNDLKKEYNGNKRTARRILLDRKGSDRSEVYADMERMLFYKKSGTYSRKEANEAYKNFVKQYEKIGVDPLIDRETFIKNFDEEEFLTVLKKTAPKIEINYDKDEKDALNLKSLLY